MLYHLHELQRKFLNPVSVWAQVSSSLFSSPYSLFAYTPFSTRLAAGYDLLHRLGKEYQKPDFGLDTTHIDGRDVAVTPEVMVEKPFCRLLHFKRALANGVSRHRSDPAVLIVAPLSGHHATLLRDTVRTLLPEHDVYITDWIDARRNPTQVNALAKRKSFKWFENHVIFQVPSTYPGYLRNVYPGFLQHAGFVAMNPDRHMTSHWDYYLDLVKGDLDDAEGHRKFYDEYNAVIDLPAEYYLDTIKIVFQEHRLPNGTWHVRGRRVAPEDIKTVRLFTIEGELDDISGSGQTQAAHELCSGIPKSRKQHMTAIGVGHYGIFSGRRWREMIYPRIRDFIRAEA